jgi:endonuclease/exonuclease/phosphatase family metal-dependent hydrolase
MTYNIQSCNDYLEGRLGSQEKLISYVREAAPDILVLNEVRDIPGNPLTEDQAGMIARGLGWNYRFAKAIDLPGGIYGNAILSRHPIHNFSVTPIPLRELKPGEDPHRWREARCVLRAEVEINGKTLVVFGSHFGLSAGEQEYAVEITSALLDAEEKPHVFMGDLNMEPNDPILAPIFARMKDTAVVMKEQKLSQVSDNPTVKIDYVFASEGIRVIDADIPESLISDHRPHWAVIEF